MKKIMLIIILVLVLIALFVTIFLLGKNNSSPVVSGDNLSGDVEYGSGDAFIPIIDKTYGNGTSYVSYKGNIYYIELINSDFENSTKTYDFRKEELSSSSQRFMNVIHPNGTVSNLFRVSGVTEFYIFEDRFYFQKSNGMIHTTNMKGEDDRELGRGKFLYFDQDEHRAYYTLAKIDGKMWYMDMNTLEIGSKEYTTSYNDDSYVFLGYYDGSLFYYKIDSSYDNIMFTKHDLKENKDYIVTNEQIIKSRDEKSYATETLRYINRLNDSHEQLKYISIGYLDGSGFFFSYGKLYEFDMDSGAVTLISDSLADERVTVIDNKLYYENGNLETANVIEYDMDLQTKTPLKYDESILGHKALVYFDGVYSYIKQPYSKELLDIAKGYGLYESAFKEFYSGDLVDNYPYIMGYSDYNFFESDIKVIGRNIFYTINIAKLDPTVEEHYRGTVVPVYVRRAVEVYLYNLDSGNNTLVYKISNNNFASEVKEIEDKISKGVGSHKVEIEEDSGDVKVPDYVLGDDEQFLDISFSNIMKSEFDVKVEEEGGTIFGTRVEYEGHHMKSEGKIRIKIKKEPGARLVVYVDNKVVSETVMD